MRFCTIEHMNLVRYRGNELFFVLLDMKGIIMVKFIECEYKQFPSKNSYRRLVNFEDIAGIVEESNKTSLILKSGALIVVNSYDDIVKKIKKFI